MLLSFNHTPDETWSHHTYNDLSITRTFDHTPDEA